MHILDGSRRLSCRKANNKFSYFLFYFFGNFYFFFLLFLFKFCSTALAIIISSDRRIHNSILNIYIYNRYDR